MNQSKQSYDVVIVGGGAAGLSGALVLARARRSVLVIDAGQPRNASAAAAHGFLTRDGVAPGDLLAMGRSEVRGYGAEVVTGEVITARKSADDRFRLDLADGSAVFADRLLVTTGLVDELPDVPGLSQRWGRDVLHCPYCHGWEVRDQPIGVLATGPMAVHQAIMWRQWSSDVMLFRHVGPEPSEPEYEQLAALGIGFVEGRVTGLEVSQDRLTGVRLADGHVIPRRAMVVASRMVARSDLLAGLGLRPTEQEMGGVAVGTRITADAMGATEVAGVWVAGNVAGVTEQIGGSVAAGAAAGAAINADLIAAHTRRAVQARREPFSPAMERAVADRRLSLDRHGLADLDDSTAT